jgi:hypothetical protein
MRYSGFKFWGADDIGLHQKNVEAYKQSIEGHADNLKYYNNLKDIIERLKEKAYSKELKDLDSKISAYKDEGMDLTSYIRYLKGVLKDKDINAGQYANFTKLVSVVDKESRIDFIEVDSQRSEYVDMLSQRLDQQNLSELLDKSLYFKTGKLNPVLFYSYLEDIAKTGNISDLAKDYNQLWLYTSYIKQYSEIDNTELFKEIELLEKNIKAISFTDDYQRKIDRASYALDILRDMFDLKLTKETLQYYRDNRSEFAPSYFINFISDAAKKYNINYKLDPVFRTIAAKLPNMERFYHIAEERDSVLVDNTLNVMRNNNANIAVLVSGGFHTEGITRLLKERQVSYIVVTPKIESLDIDGTYGSVLLGKNTEFENFIDQAKENTKSYRESI